MKDQKLSIKEQAQRLKKFNEANNRAKFLMKNYNKNRSFKDQALSFVEVDTPEMKSLIKTLDELAPVKYMVLTKGEEDDKKRKPKSNK